MELLLYLQKKLVQNIMSAFYKLLIKKMERETKDAVSILFQVPEALKSQYQFIAGQYVTLKLTLDGKEIRRAYSICSAPYQNELKVTVKAISNGLFSVFANEKLKEGDLLEVGTPEGKFVYEPKPDVQRNYMGFVAGSGITPVMSIVKSLLKNEPNSTFVLVYGNKTIEDIIFKQELHDLQSRFVGRLFVEYVLSQAPNATTLTGRIDHANTQLILNLYKEIEFSKYFLCGPEGMINAVTEVLKEQHVAEKNIKYELFSTSASNETASDSLSGHTSISILLDDEEITFEMSQKETLLDAALKQGVDAPYSCQGGICSSCLAKITKGSAIMKKNAILTDEEVAQGLVLTCQAHPTSNEIYVDFDDV